jgi:hypothetical protein
MGSEINGVCIGYISPYKSLSNYPEGGILMGFGGCGGRGGSWIWIIIIIIFLFFFIDEDTCDTF